MVYIERALPCQSGWLCQLKIGFGPNPFSFLFNYTYAYGGAGAGGGGVRMQCIQFSGAVGYYWPNVRGLFLSALV